MNGFDRNNNNRDDDDDRKLPAKDTGSFTTTDPPSSAGRTSVESHSTDNNPLYASYSHPPLRRRRNDTTPNNNNNHLSQLVSILIRHMHVEGIDWRRAMIVTSATSFTALVVFLGVVLPYTASIALMIFLSSTGAFVFAAYNYMIDGYYHLIAHRGIGEFLPSWLVRSLTETSIHEWLTNDNFMMENRHLLLYFLPGIPTEHIENYINRLAPQHRERLRRRGLGHILGPGFMRLLLGEERMRPQPAIEVIVEEQPHDTSRLDYDDSDDDSASDLGLDITANDLAGGLTDRQASGLARSFGLRVEASRVEANDVAAAAMRGEETSYLSAVSTQDDLLSMDEVYYAEEELVISEALWESLYDGMWTPAWRFILGYTSDVLTPRTQRWIRYGMGLSLVSVGLAIVGHQTGMYSTSRSSIQRRYTVYPEPQTLSTTAMLGFAATGIALYSQWYLRPFSSKSSRSKKNGRKK